MSRLPRLRGKDLIKRLERAGFVVARTRGSHSILKHKDGRSTVVPVHAGEQIGPGLLTKILADCEMTPDQLRDL
jgi:predicted RNA binding protein YcfA (HicA-like mRNA interferase family)